MAEAPTLAATLATLNALGVARAATWFDDYAHAYAFAVSFRSALHSRSELQEPLQALTSAAVRQAVPEYDPELVGGQLVVYLGDGTVSLGLARAVTATTEDHLSIDLTSTESVFARPAEHDEPEDEHSAGWDVEWHAVEGLDHDAELAKIEAVFVEGTGDTERAREWSDAIESVMESAMGREDDDEAALDPDEAMTALRDALAALAATGATTATVRYSVEDFGQALGDALDAAATEIGAGSPEPADVVAAVTNAVEALFGESPWQLDALELDGRAVTDADAAANLLRQAGMLLLLARLGDWDELWSTSGSSGVLEIDQRVATATITHRHPTWRSLPPARVILRPRDDG